MATTVTKTIKSSGGDYTSLSAWEAGEQRDLVTLNEIAVAECYSMADTSAVVINGWTTGASNYIRIYTPTTERHDGTPGTGYRLETSSDVIQYYEDYIRFEGLSLKNTGSLRGFRDRGAGGEIRIGYCLVQGGSASYGIHTDSTGPVYKVYNTIVFDFSTGMGGGGANTYYVYNCTFKDNITYGYRTWAAGATNKLRNVLCDNNTTKDIATSGGATNDIDYCASSDASADDRGVLNNRINQTFTFVDSVNNDFHLASSDAGALDFGTDLSADPNLSFTTDIDGETRSGTWDIGADEYVSAGGVIIPVSGSTAGLSAVAGLAGMAYNAAGTAIGLSGINALAGLGYIVSGSAAAVSLPYASAGIVRGVNGGLNGLSLLSGAISTYALTALAGNISTLSVLNGVAGLTFHVSGPAAGTSSFLASAGLSSLITGFASGASYFTAALTGLSTNNFSGQINTISTFAGNVAMRYGLGGASPSALLLTGHLYEIYSSAGLFQAYSSLTGSPLFAGQISPASRAGSPRFDITRYGGGTLPLMQSDSDIVTVTQDNNNPRVTR